MQQEQEDLELHQVGGGGGGVGHAAGAGGSEAALDTKRRRKSVLWLNSYTYSAAGAVKIILLYLTP